MAERPLLAMPRPERRASPAGRPPRETSRLPMRAGKPEGSARNLSGWNMRSETRAHLVSFATIPPQSYPNAHSFSR